MDSDDNHTDCAVGRKQERSLMKFSKQVEEDLEASANTSEHGWIVSRIKLLEAIAEAAEKVRGKKARWANADSNYCPYVVSELALNELYAALAAAREGGALERKP